MKYSLFCFPVISQVSSVLRAVRRPLSLTAVGHCGHWLLGGRAGPFLPFAVVIDQRADRARIYSIWFCSSEIY